MKPVDGAPRGSGVVGAGEEPAGDVTRLLVDWRGGDEHALERLIPVVYDELRRRAHAYLGHERDDHTLQATALVHEAFLRLVDQRQVGFQDRAHFFAVAAQMMRRILVDHARRRVYAKRGGDAVRVPLDEALQLAAPRGPDLVALDDALGELATVDPELARLVELRFFGGLELDEIAAVLDVSTPTVARRWRSAKAWLFQSLRGAFDDPDESSRP